MKTNRVKKIQRLKEEIRKLKSFLAFLNLRQEERKRRLNEAGNT